MARARRQRKHGKPAPAPPPSERRGPMDARGGAGRWFPALAIALLLGYLALFYFSEPFHWQPLTFILLPDHLVRQWMGGSVRRLGVADRLPLLAAAGGLLATAWLLGRGLLRWLGCEQALTWLERFVLGSGLGLQALSLWTLAWGLAGQLHRPWLVVGPPLLAAGWVAARSLRQRGGPTAGLRGPGTGRDLAGQDSPPSEAARADGERTTWFDRYGLVLLVPPALLILAGGMLPPWEFDVREYHLQVPKEWYLDGRIGFVPHNVYGNMPLGAEMHALLAMVAWPSQPGWWYGALVGKTIIAGCAVLTALAVYAAGRRFWNRRAGIVAAAVYLATPWTAQVSMAGLNDGVVGFYTVLAVFAALLAVRRTTGPAESGEAPAPHPTPHPTPHPAPNPPTLSDRRYAALSGLLAGAAVSCKYPALLFVVVPLAGWWFAAGSPPTPQWRVQRAGIFLLAVCLSCGLWFGKNWVLAGNPTYPLLHSVFEGPQRTDEQARRWRVAHQVPPDAQGRRYSLRQAAGSFRDVAWASRWLSPILVPLAMLSLWQLRRPGRPRAVVLALAGFLAFGLLTWWLATHRIERFLVPLLPIAALLAGAGAVGHPGKFWRGLVAGLLVATVLAESLVISSRLFPADNRFLMALSEFRPDLPHPADPGFAFTDPVHHYLNEHVPAGSRVLLVGDAQPFDLQAEALYNTCFDRSRLEQIFDGARSAAARRQALREAGISHVYVKWSEIDRYRSPGNYGFPDFVTRSLIRQELVERQQVLRPIPLERDPEQAELFEVR